jgi:hypothetical protein
MADDRMVAHGFGPSQGNDPILPLIKSLVQ